MSGDEKIKRLKVVHDEPSPQEKELETAMKLIFSEQSLAKLVWLSHEHGIDLRAAANVAVASEFRSFGAELD